MTSVGSYEDLVCWQDLIWKKNKIGGICRLMRAVWIYFSLPDSWHGDT